jgi:hypothetical protein
MSMTRVAAWQCPPAPLTWLPGRAKGTYLADRRPGLYG